MTLSNNGFTKSPSTHPSGPAQQALPSSRKAAPSQYRAGWISSSPGVVSGGHRLLVTQPVFPITERAHRPIFG
ncbi:hypothetical protein E2C01_046088 [Portunus trituberculatus]|uniref:Uncharacterized protein n=1 Tax=Portunus trituberculatus TaxID=210409 RepID=A0A5B7G6N5_PORTR|nr:hypothetical protein [Portunus trituberculatus]